MPSVEFIVPGSPVGKARPRAARRGNTIAFITPAKTACYENLVRLSAASAMRGAPLFTGPVELLLQLFVTPAASWPKYRIKQALEGMIKPATKPDLDNMLKSIADGCNGVVFVDDAQITDCIMSKRYAPLPSARVVITELVP